MGQEADRLVILGQEASSCDRVAHSVQATARDRIGIWAKKCNCLVGLGQEASPQDRVVQGVQATQRDHFMLYA